MAVSARLLLEAGHVLLYKHGFTVNSAMCLVELRVCVQKGVISRGVGVHARWVRDPTEADSCPPRGRGLCGCSPLPLMVDDDGLPHTMTEREGPTGVL